MNEVIISPKPPLKNALIGAITACNSFHHWLNHSPTGPHCWVRPSMGDQSNRPLNTASMIAT
ncbi:hypothetical protein D3C72_2494500 [compost metagenome]